MELTQAVNVVEQALNVSAQKGVFGLQDSALIYNALNVLKSFNSNIGTEEDNSEPQDKLAGKSQAKYDLDSKNKK